ncbi:hypothetical protein IB024_00125 [Brucella sp. 6810]|uniref:hypothetical protein n=1 Tax=Brucella sp. 6810 TaxID=2769351 RepID=UPI00165BFEC8|nr:hypothetical protein [Brucella sp. 6810]QNQ62211.1 hypothetical protein IB024_00125 [Brucella sp. 6810]
MSTRPTAKSSSDKNETVKPEAKQADADKAKCRSDDRESVRVARDGAGWPTKIIFENRLLYLTVPHLSYAIQDQSERDEKRILIARHDGRNRHSDTSQNERNSPLRIIAQILGFHKDRPHFAEIKFRFHLQQDGSFWQEAILPPGWVVVETCLSNHSRAGVSRYA